MSGTSKRSTIYFDSQLHAALRLKAAHTNRSVSDIVNDAVREALAEDQEDLAPYFPSLHCVVGEDVSNEVAINLGLASLRAQISRFVRPARAMRIAHDRPGIATRPYVLGQRPVENIFSEAI